MKQQTLAMAAGQGFERHRKPTRRDAFLERMNRVVPWEALCTVVDLVKSDLARWKKVVTDAHIEAN
jgi:hypothetical protein